MSVRSWCVVGLICPLLVMPISAGQGPMPHLATAEISPPSQGTPKVAKHLSPEGRRTDGSRPASGDHTREETVHLNFRQVDILQMITLMSELTGKNFLVDDKVRGKVTLIAPHPVTRAQAYEIFLAALAIQGFTVISQGPINTIVPLRDAKGRPLPTMIDPSPPHP